MVSVPRPKITLDSFRHITWYQAWKTLPALVLCTWGLETLLFIPTLSSNDDNQALYVCGMWLLYLILSIPASIVLVRVQVSIIPEEFPISIPCDQSFLQDTSSTEGSLTLMMAIKSLDFSLLSRAVSCVWECLATGASMFFCYVSFCILTLVSINAVLQWIKMSTSIKLCTEEADEIKQAGWCQRRADSYNNSIHISVC